MKPRRQNPAMTAAVIELACEGLRCEVLPALGGCIAGLWLDGVPVLRAAADPPALRSARQAGCYPLVPFANRLGHATLQWQGTSPPLVRLGGDEPHAIHGVGWQRPWTVLEQDARTLVLSYEHRPDAAWPFAFDASQTLRVSAHELALTLSLTNQSPQPAPAGLGWHPSFVKRAGSRIAFEATVRWEMNAEKLPTHRLPVRGLDADCAGLEIDHCFDGWHGSAHLRDPVLRTRIDSSLSHLVVFTGEARDFIAIEPVSHVNNAVNLLAASGARAGDLGLRMLAPGESMTAQMSIQVEGEN
jgi:aldose 1-epimerase